MKLDDWKLPLAVFGFIVGAAGFFHYQPHKSGEVAAWIQAIATIVAIWWAANSARKLLLDGERSKRKTYATVLCEIADSVANLTSYVKRELPDLDALSAVARGNTRFEFGELVAMESAMDQIVLHELPLPELVKPTLYLRSSLRQLRENVQYSICVSRTIQPDDFEKLFDAITRLNAVWAETAEDVRKIAESV